MGGPALRYAAWREVPFYRRQWFFWLLYIVPGLTPIALGLLTLGDVYYVRRGELRSFGRANRIVAGLFGVLWAVSFLRMLLARS